KTSWTCGLTLIRRIPEPAATSRLWVFKSTPRPALEMYSSPPASITQGGTTSSRHACARDLGNRVGSNAPVCSTERHGCERAVAPDRGPPGAVLVIVAGRTAQR